MKFKKNTAALVVTFIGLSFANANAQSEEAQEVLYQHAYVEFTQAPSADNRNGGLITIYPDGVKEEDCDGCSVVARFGHSTEIESQGEKVRLTNRAYRDLEDQVATVLVSNNYHVLRLNLMEVAEASDLSE